MLFYADYPPLLALSTAVLQPIPWPAVPHQRLKDIPVRLTHAGAKTGLPSKRY